MGNGKVTVLANGSQLNSGDMVKGTTKLTITAEPNDGETLRSLTVNGIAFDPALKYEVYANTIIVADFGEKIGLPYYLDAAGKPVFIGFAEDADEDGRIDENEYIAPDGAEIQYAENPKMFIDINGHWAEPYIQFVVQRELFTGVSKERFSPDGEMSRAMFATVIGRLYERSFGQISGGEAHQFTDCDYAAYYGKYIDWAADNRIIEGYGNGTFGPDDSITREQMASILYRFASFMNVCPENMQVTLQYADATAIADWAQDAAKFCQLTNIITGVGENAFAPKNTATRAEVSTIINRFISYVIAR